MLDKGEKRIGFNKECIKNIGRFCGKRFGTLAIIVLIGLVGFQLFQNNKMIDHMEKLLSNNDRSVHEIFDDTKVIAAYKSGTKDGLTDEEAWLFDKLKEVIGKVIKDDMTVFEKEKAIYDWQFKFMHYKEAGLNPINPSDAYDDFTPYGVLHSHNAICVGNATTFKLFMGALDIPCKIVHSTENGEHAWDIVQMEDGEWYHVDLTFDGGEKEPVYSVFNVPDTVKDDGSWPWDHNEIPAAKGTKFCYMSMIAEEGNNIYDIPKIIKKSLDEKKKLIAFTLKDRKGFSNQVASYIEGFFTIDGGNMYFNNAYAIGDKIVYVYTVSNSESEEETGIPAEILDKLNDALSEVVDSSEFPILSDDMGEV